ncbi:ABC transporter ATP-binding protein [Sediminibacillus massiliensis]|uniref:ABC transporter ATP-binding protein n=1 Tax=Sediminibacillus massiliensis TaxID=1926277 RepID=UPI0009888964|nr:ABC transporter ATP-binding protein [Sediminibacillus massiliensis]
MKDLLYFVKQINRYAGKILYINLFAMIGIGLLEGIGVLLLVPMISISGIVDLESSEIAALSFLDFFQQMPSLVSLSIILIIYVLIVAGQSILNRNITVKNAVIQQGFLRHIQLETYRLITHSNWSFFIKKRKSDLINLLTTEVARASMGAHSFLQFAASLVSTVIQIGLAFYLSPNITTFVLLSGLILLFFNRKFLTKSMKLGNKNFELRKTYMAGITDQMNGIKDIKSNTLEASRMNWYRSLTKQMLDEQVAYTKLKATSQLYYKVASSVLIAAFIFIAIQLFSSQAAQLMLVIVIFSRLWPRVAGIQASLEQIATTIPSFKSVKAIQEECKNACEFEFGAEKVKPLHINEGIRCKGVFFRYNHAEPMYALKNVNIAIPANQMTAFVGKSGAGKSTLIDLLMGLNQPEQGQVLIDDQPLTSDNLIALRRSISYVPQDPFLFNATIRENLALVVPDTSEEQMWEALRFSSAADFVYKLPNGLDTVIGDRGIKLSGGERQRLVLARAILRNPSILVLDEATSALDTENEAHIQAALERLKGKMTIIVIAHRLSTIRDADQVIVLDQGEIVQQGEFNQLSEQKRSVFSNLLAKQIEVLS